MSGCCLDHNQSKKNSAACSHEKHNHQEINSPAPEEQEPQNPLKKLFWKIGKADVEKKMNNSTQAKSCCH